MKDLMNSDPDIEAYLKRINEPFLKSIEGKTDEEKEDIRKCWESDIAVCNGFADPHAEYFNQRRKEAIKDHYVKFVDELIKNRPTGQGEE